MRHIAKVLFIAALAAGCQSTTARYTRDDTSSRSTLSGQTIRLNGFYNLARDCKVIGVPNVRVVSTVSGGQLTDRAENGFPSFGSDNPRSVCNRRRSPARAVYYTPARGFTGQDRVVFEIYWTDGEVWRETYDVAVR